MSNPYIEEAEEAILHTYNRYPRLYLDKGEGVHLYDVTWKRISGFCSRYCSTVLWAINIKEYNEALKDQIDKLTHISNLYYY